MRKVTIADIQRNPTDRIQRIMDDGESFVLPAGDFIFEDTLVKRSVGQQILGEGPNRTRLVQATEGKGIFREDFPSTGNVDCQWRGRYSANGMGYGAYGLMTLETANPGTGTAISVGNGPDWGGDFLHLHDLFTWGWGKHVATNGIAQIKIERVVCKGAVMGQESFGVGLEIIGATPNSHLIQGVALSGLDIGLDILGNGFQANVGDINLCRTGVRVRGGSGAFHGGHLETCERYFDIGYENVGAQVNLIGVNMDVAPTNTICPIRLNCGSVLTGAVSGGASPGSGVPLVECMLPADFAYLQNYPGTNEGITAPENYQYRNIALGITRRFSPFKVLLNNDWIPAPDATQHGVIYHVHNGLGIGDERLIECRLKSDGTFFWCDL